MATKIVKASDPDIISLSGIVYTGYYFNPVTNEAYSDMVPGFGLERLYELKPTPTGKYRFRDRTMSLSDIHETLKSRCIKNYNKIMATTSQQPKVNQVFKSFKIKCKDWGQAEQIIEKLKAEGYTLKSGVYGKVMQHVKCFVVNSNGTYDWFAVYDSWTMFGMSTAPEITFEEYCGSKHAQSYQSNPLKGWIIGKLNAKSKIEISDNPRIHSTIESAETERLRLMNAHVGETFVILEIKSYGKVETNPVTKIW